ncbi:MAG TPA: hypothetical protein VKY65_17430 [Alphaproteobacteria bacterium]|nr:hypothetical protein [Alphaproteobacteria bacterium]
METAPARSSAGPLLAALLIAGCGADTNRADPRTALVGMSEAQLVLCVGAPQQTLAAGDRRYLVYHTNGVLHPGYLEGLPSQLPLLGTLPSSKSGTKVQCDATFVLRNGAVEAVNLRTDPPQDAAHTGEICTPLTRNCPPR